MNKLKNILIVIGVILFIGMASSDSSDQPTNTTQTAPIVESAADTIEPAEESTEYQETVQYEAPVEEDSGLSNDNYYTNSEGEEVHSPAYSDTVPAGASAQCEDGTYSFSQSRRGTCSRHGGVAIWL